MDTGMLVSRNAMIATCEQSGFREKEIRLFRELQIEKIEYNSISMVSDFSACNSLGAFSIREWVHEFVIRKGLETNKSITNVLIDKYAMCGNIDLAKNIF
ncbi:hypothetical protein GIB67_025797 [Kingdonia uniflora]|uniref:Pentatricopeptide repeat-containing protein n=1 Tax=Kingdonia uniflora TaxID=39325 RepID=A0A7J7NT55_9MAGN|nr:hypothetical protein GIB67_025797 [Kingdonia uniflora]